MSLPFEYTAEINEAFYQKLARPIKAAGATDLGQMRGSAVERGITGDMWEGAAEAGIRNNTANKLSDLNADMGFNIAGLQRDERLTKENRAFTTSERTASQDWNSGEAAKGRTFQEYMAQLGYGNDEKNRSQQEESGLIGALGGIVGNAVGGPIGGYFASRLFSGDETQPAYSGRRKMNLYPGYVDPATGLPS